MIAELCLIAIALLAGIPAVRLIDFHAEPRRRGAGFLRVSAPPREPSSRAGEALLIGIGICAAMLAILPWQRWILITAIVIIAAAAFRPQRIKFDASFLLLLFLL